MATLLEHTVMPAGGDFASLDACVDHILADHHDLLGDDKYAEIKIDGDWTGVTDTAAVTITGLHTDATHCLYIYTTAASRHKGIPSTSYYNIKAAGAGSAAVQINNSFVTIEGVQAWNTTTWGSSNGFRIGAAAYEHVYVLSCIGRTDGTSATQCGFMDDDLTVDSYFANCLAYSCGAIGFMVHHNAYNCTAAHCVYGFQSPYYIATWENCLAHGNTTADFSQLGTQVPTLNNCSSGDGTADDFNGSNNLVDQAFTFVNHDGNDFHLASTDAGARDHGKSEAAIFTTDVDGETRTGTWDIGFDEYVAGGATLVVQDAGHGHTADNIALTQAHTLAVGEALHSQAADNIALTQHHNLIVAEASHGHLAEAILLSQVHNLIVQESLHGHGADSPVLTQAHVLAIAKALSGHSADNIDLSLPSTVLVVSDALNAHAADNIALAQAHILAVQNSWHAHRADNIVWVTDGERIYPIRLPKRYADRYPARS